MQIRDKIINYIKENYLFLISLIIIILLFSIKVPYIIYKPGHLINLNDRVTIDNNIAKKGSINMTCVSAIDGSIPFILLAKIIPNWDVYGIDDITYENQSFKESIKAGKVSYKSSIDVATINAYKEAEMPLNITNTHYVITYIAPDANTTINLLDELVSIEGQTFSSLDDFKKLVNTYNVGDTINLIVKRGSKEKEVSAVVYNTIDGKKVGIEVTNTYEYETKPKLSIKNKNNESGPSGGLMLSLAIYNNLIEDDIANGKKISGTGTIDINGNIGEIGGVKYKILGAEKNKADVFLCPVNNYKEALKVKKDNHLKIKIIKVDTFNNAIKSLENL